MKKDYNVIFVDNSLKVLSDILTGEIVYFDNQELGITDFDKYNILDSVFRNCQKLKKVSLKTMNVNSMDGVFKDCSNLETVILPDVLKEIGYNAFDSCISLSNIIIPALVNIIDIGAFYGCSNLNSITFLGTIEQWNAIEKGLHWNQHVPATYVQCSDGQVTL